MLCVCCIVIKFNQDMPLTWVHTLFFLFQCGARKLRVAIKEAWLLLFIQSSLLHYSTASIQDSKMKSHVVIAVVAMAVLISSWHANAEFFDPCNRAIFSGKLASCLRIRCIVALTFPLQ